MNPTTLGALLRGPGFWAWTETTSSFWTANNGRMWQGRIRFGDGREFTTHSRLTTYKPRTARSSPSKALDDLYHLIEATTKVT